MTLCTNLPSNLQGVDVIIAGGGSAGCIVAARLADADPKLSILIIEGGTNNFERSDFDAWETPGWSANELLPYLKKLETYHGEDKTSCHGNDGPIHVSGSTYRASRLENDFITAVTKLGYPVVDDLNNLDTGNGVMRALRYVNPQGKRQDTAHTYIHPRLKDGEHPNLHVLTESLVERILFEGTRAVGVSYKPNQTLQPDADNAVRTVKARKLVILSCGALGTPLVLERSGVGSSDILQRASVDLVADLPGVGCRYQDHHMMLYPLGPAFQEAWKREFRDVPDKPMMIMSLVACFPGDPSSVPVGQYFGIATFSLYPYSRGYVHITGPGLEHQPDLDLGFLADPNGVDLKKHVWIYKKHREIIRWMKVYRGELAPGHPPFPAYSQAAPITINNPLEDVKDIKYTAEDDAIIEEWIRGHVDTTWHSLGTCKMAPREEFGVMDECPSVYGVEGLKIADLSIPPSNVGANTNNTATAIGEKAADIFIRELGLGTNFSNSQLHIAEDNTFLLQV
ncbi:hypothetical protein JX265_009442 [Neoarthrinium moseri]|uniref:Glucose-methanol-choline oxidoreductase N-terminal domain-containing protein n=1 Tax=Neoarthrinium moseri TaxID=1658444 RepID=A0A9Q0AMT1_9PEZI|nr:hypothetical protein JX265_009442 [Neoarthrinium moseri]